MTAHILDTTGLSCPLPVLKAEKAMRRIAKGDELEVRASDPLTAVDIPHMCRTHKYLLVSSTRDGDVLVFRIRRPRRDHDCDRRHLSEWSAPRKHD